MTSRSSGYSAISTNDAARATMYEGRIRRTSRDWTKTVVTHGPPNQKVGMASSSEVIARVSFTPGRPARAVRSSRISDVPLTTPIRSPSATPSGCIPVRRETYQRGSDLRELLLAQVGALHARQDLLGEVGQFVEVVDKVEYQAVEADGVQAGQLAGDVVGLPDGAVGAASQDAALERRAASAAEDALVVGPTARVVGVHLGEVAHGAHVDVFHQVHEVILCFTAR